MRGVPLEDLKTSQPGQRGAAIGAQSHCRRRSPLAPKDLRPMRAFPRLPAALALAVLSAALPLHAAGAQDLPLSAESRRSLVLTVYNQNLGLVSETRRVDLPAGETLLAIEEDRKSTRLNSGH